MSVKSINELYFQTKIAKFEKVSFEQFKKDWEEQTAEQPVGLIYHLTTHSEDLIKNIYDNIILPKRGTELSAGYDFFAPADIIIPLGSSFMIPTGIKCSIQTGWFLDLNPRSGQGFRYGLHLANTRGIIDADYYNNTNNEGHIMVKLVNDSCISKEDVYIPEGKAFCQGIFTIHGLTYNDDITEKRTGGFGSTG